MLEEDVQSDSVISLLEMFNGMAGNSGEMINRKITELKKSNGGFYGFDSKNSDAHSKDIKVFDFTFMALE